MKQAFPDAQIYCFYMDLRMFGRHYEDLYLSAQKEYGVRFIRGRVAEVSENVDGSLMVKAEDTVAGKPLKVTLDLLVLMAGMRPSASGKRVGELLEMPVEEDGFFAVRDGILSGQKASFQDCSLLGPRPARRRCRRLWLMPVVLSWRLTGICPTYSRMLRITRLWFARDGRFRFRSGSKFQNKS